MNPLPRRGGGTARLTSGKVANEFNRAIGGTAVCGARPTRCSQDIGLSNSGEVLDVAGMPKGMKAGTGARWLQLNNRLRSSPASQLRNRFQSRGLPDQILRLRLVEEL